MHVAQIASEQRVAQLVTVLGELKRLHDELAIVVQRKLDAMRAANADAIRSTCSREEFLAQKIREQDGLRRQLLELVGTQMGLAGEVARAMTVTELADRVGEPARSRLLVLAAALRERVRATADTNRVVGLVSHEMLKHFRQVYGVMAEANRAPGLYSRRGRNENPAITVFEAVG